MADLLEFFVPTTPSDLDNENKNNKDHYHIEVNCDFDIPANQQLDDLGRLFDALIREKSPTAMFSKPELFYPLFSYIKAMQNKNKTHEITRASRHKICHEIGERMKKLLQVGIAFLKRQKNSNEGHNVLALHVRSTLKMYAFIICNTLMSSAPPMDEEDFPLGSQKTLRKKRRRENIGFGDDDSGVDMDGRELALNSLLELCTPEITSLWNDNSLEHGLLNLIFKTCLHMITQKANISEDAQSIASAISLLLARVTSALLAKNESIDPLDLISPLVELSLKSESAALFLSKLVADIEHEECDTVYSEKLLQAIFEGMCSAALNDAPGDATAAKNISMFLAEVSKRCVSAIIKMQDIVLPALQSENYDIRKAVVTCLAEMVIQKYSGHTRAPDEEIRDKYLNELFFQIMDINPFVRNHVLHIWEKLIEAKAVPKRYFVAIMETIVGRLEDKNYLVRDSALSVICAITQKNWFGPVLNSSLIEKKLEESRDECEKLVGDDSKIEKGLLFYGKQFQPLEDSTNSLELGEENSKEEEENVVPDFSDEEISLFNKVVFYSNTLKFIGLIKLGLQYAIELLESKTERDVVESIKLIVTCTEHHVEGADKAFLHVLILVFQGEVKIQLAVRDAFVEVIFNSVSQLSSSTITRATISAQKLISILKCASEGEVSATERIFSLLKSNPAFSRHISSTFLDAIWGIAEGSLDQEASAEDRRTAMRIYSLLSKYFWKDLRTRLDNVLAYLESKSAKDNIIISFAFQILEHQSLDPNFTPIPVSADPFEHPILKHIVNHLCRSTTAMGTWMVLATSAIDAIHHLCLTPVVLFTYIIEFVHSRVERGEDSNAKAQLFYLLSLTALKQLVSIETAERLQLKSLEENGSKAKNTDNTSSDAMNKELGFGSHECKRHAIQELAQRRKEAIMQNSVWADFSSMVVSACKQKAKENLNEPFERICAVMCLCNFMVVNEEFCAKNLNLLFTIVANKLENWVIKTNVVVALGDLACVHPNLLGPYLKEPTTGFFKLLVDEDVRVRAVTIQVCSHLVLGEMLRIRDHLYTIVKLVADPDETIARNAMTFVQNLAVKEKEKTGNLIPPLVSQLSNVMPSENFQLVLRTLLEKVEGDKPLESLVDRLCQRFEAYSERSKKRITLARNIAFCLSELNYSSEKIIKRISSEGCFQQYRLWLRDEEVLEYFKIIIAKAKRSGRMGVERRDKTVVEEWEARILSQALNDDTENVEVDEEERVSE